MRNRGQRRLQGKTEDMKDIVLTYQVTDVRRILAAVRKICAAGNRVVFDDDGSFIQNKATKEITQVYQRNGTYAFDMWVLVPDCGDDMDINGCIEPEDEVFLRHL